MTVNINKVALGVCDVKLGTLDLGATKGGVEVTIETSTYEVKLDQTGETPAKEIITGTSVKVKVPMAETDLARLAQVIPQAQGVVESTVTTGVLVSTGVNIDLFAEGLELLLHPTGVASGTTDGDFGLFKAAGTANISFTYNTNSERIYEIEFKGYPDTTHQDANGRPGVFWFGKKPAASP